MNDNPIAKIHSIISQIMSEEGFQNGSLCIKCENNLDVILNVSEHEIKLMFNNNKPVAKITKFITLSFDISAIILGKDSGMIIVDKFPDVPFVYEWLNNENHDA